jgi:hypothetical protein
MPTYTNNDGLIESFGIPGDFASGQLKTQGARKELVIKIDGVAETPALGAHQDNESFLPAGAVLESAKLIVTTAFAGGTDISLGTEEKDGTDIDVDGIDAAIATASLTLGAVIDCDGADIGTIVDSANDAYPALTTNGTFTAGEADLLLTYIEVN